LKISIITATYNSASVINDCLNSVKLQKYKDIDHIIIDGNSADETLQILETKRSQIKTLISEPDHGIYDAMNKGIKNSTGEIVGFLNSDDIYANDEVLSDVVNLFKNNKSLDACYADLIYTSQNDISKNVRYWKSSKFNLGLFSRGWCPPHQTFFVRRKIYEKFGCFNVKYKIASDVELMMRFLEVNKINVCYVPKTWIKMRLGGTTNKSVRNILIQNKEIIHALKTHNLDFNYLSFCFHKLISRSLQFLRSENK